MRLQHGVLPRCLSRLHRRQRPCTATSLDRLPPAICIHRLLRGKHSRSSQIKSKRGTSQSSKAWLERQQKDPYVQRAQELGLPSRAYFKLQEVDEVHYLRLRTKNEKKKKKGNGMSDSDERNRQTRLIRPDALVLDLGAAPGGWSLHASTRLNRDLGGAVVAVDLLPLDETLRSNDSDVSSRIKSNLGRNFQFIHGDFTKNQTRLEIAEALANISCESIAEGGSYDNADNNRRADLILSDMAANFTGDHQTDALRTLNLCEMALAFAAGEACFDASRAIEDERGGMLEGGGAFLCKYFVCGRQHEEDLMRAARKAFLTVHSIKPKASRKESSEMYLLALDYNCKRRKKSQ